MAEETEVPMILDGEPIVTQSDTAIPDSAATDHPNGGEKRGREETGDPVAEGEENGPSKKSKMEAAETPAEEQQKPAETSAEEEKTAKVAQTPAEEEQIEKAEDTKEGEEELKEMKEGEEELKDGDVSLGPKNFKSGSDMFNYFFKFLHFWVPNLDINEYEHMVLLDLLKKGHAEHEKKIGVGVRAFQVRYHPTYKSRCFFLVRVNGSSDDFSFRKCVDSILPLPENLKVPSASDGKMGGGGGGGSWRGRGGGRGGRGRGRRGGRN